MADFVRQCESATLRPKVLIYPNFWAHSGAANIETETVNIYWETLSCNLGKLISYCLNINRRDKPSPVHKPAR